jgi:alpha-galactosidase
MLLLREIRQRPNSSSRRAAIGREKDKRMSLTRKTLYIGFAALLAFALLLCIQPTAAAQGGAASAATPPMGWNSWDSYGTTVNEAQVKANADWMAKNLKAFGWQYIVVDMEWFVTNPIPEGNSKDFKYSLDANGRYTPPVNRFPSAGDAGFKPLADYVHSLGLKFGIHILQGIPKEAVKANDPIEGSAFHAADAADTSGTCIWNYDNYDVKDTPAGQAYYDSIARLYARWGVDLIKVDCIAMPYKGSEIRMLSTALGKTGRSIVLSLSPGPAPLEKQLEMQQYATQWRISNDIWDIWHSTEFYPQGLNDQFIKVAAWAGDDRKGRYPDADMLPLGYLGPAAGWGTPRQTRLTHDEQRTFLTLWGIFRSPLMMGGDLPHNDDWTTALLTNREFLDVDQHARDTKVAITSDKDVVWTSKPEDGAGHYVAIFNRAEEPQTLHYTWTQLGIHEGSYRLRDLWEHKDLGPATGITVTLAPHASVLYSARP